jgi:acetolactate synthase-1/2/3 large subunit
MGIGAAVGNPDLPTVVMVGDGGLSVHLGELATLADESPWCVVIVFNDGGYGVLRNLQDSTVGRRSGVDLFTPNFGVLARSLDLPHALARSADEFAVEFKRLLQLRRPALLEVDVAALQPQPRPFVPPVHVPGSFER